MGGTEAPPPSVCTAGGECMVGLSPHCLASPHRGEARPSLGGRVQGLISPPLLRGSNSWGARAVQLASLSGQGSNRDKSFLHVGPLSCSNWVWGGWVHAVGASTSPPPTPWQAWGQILCWIPLSLQRRACARYPIRDGPIQLPSAMSRMLGGMQECPCLLALATAGISLPLHIEG